MFHRTLTTLTVAVGIFLALGCSASNDTTAPATTSGVDQTAQTSQVTQHELWGMWDVIVDGSTGEIQAIPMRTAEFNANVVRFLQPPGAPIELITIKMNVPESDILKGLVTMDITLRHPFPGATKFRGFDVRGIMMAFAGQTGMHDPKVKYFGPNNTQLLNADGYTRWWNQTEFTTFGTILGYTEGHYAKPGFTSSSTVNAYKVHTPALQPGQPFYQLDPTTRCSFPAIDGSFARKYRMQFDTTQVPIFKFKYAVDASWSLPNASYAPNYPIEAFDSKANCQEAYLVKIEEFNEIPYYVDQWVSGGNIDFNLTIGDWQSNYDVLGQVAHVWIESPTLFAAPIDVRNLMTLVAGTATQTQATFNIRIEDMLPSGLEGQQLLITVESTSPNTFKPQIDGDTSGIAYPDSPLAAYAIVDVPITNLAPQGDYAYCYFIPDWCATMRNQCAADADNQQLLANIITQNIDGSFNDFTHVQSWEGKTNTQSQTAEAITATCASLGYSFERTYNDYFNPAGSRAVIVVLLNTSDAAPDPPFTQQEATDMLNYIKNGGILFFMCEASGYFNDTAVEQLMGWLGMLMEYGGGAEPEYTDGYTDNITWHWLTDGIDKYHYYTCGTWVTQDPHVLTLVETETDQKLVIMYPLPLE